MRRLALLLAFACGGPQTPTAVQVATTATPAQPSASASDCEDDAPYKPAPAWSGRAAHLPSVPTLPTTPVKDGDAYTVFGARHSLNSRIHNVEVTTKDITIVGYIVDTNLPRVPKCALHATGIADPVGCVTEMPTFWLNDVKGQTKDAVRVMGWASNFPNVFMAYNAYGKAPRKPYKDELWAVEVPFPLPAVGARVKITGRYGVNFAKSSTGIVADPIMGILTYGSLQVLEQAPQPATFPQLKK